MLGMRKKADLILCVLATSGRITSGVWIMFQLKSHLTNLCFACLVMLVVGMFPIYANAHRPCCEDGRYNLVRLILLLVYIIVSILFLRIYFLKGKLSFISPIKVNLKTKMLYIKIAFLLISFLLYSYISVIIWGLANMKAIAAVCAIILVLMILSFCMGLKKAARVQSGQFSNKEVIIKIRRCSVAYFFLFFLLLLPYLYLEYVR